MLRVGLTGDLGSGKSTVGSMFASLGARVFSSDEMARTMMQPDEPVHAQIVEHFGPSVVTADGKLDRRALARLAFEQQRVEELNAIVHPAVLQEQARLLTELAHADPHAIAVIESALIFTTKHDVEGQAWRQRFHRIVLVRAPLEAKIERFVRRLSAGHFMDAHDRARLAEDARARLALQSAVNESHADECIVIENDGDLVALNGQVLEVWADLRREEASAG